MAVRTKAAVAAPDPDAPASDDAGPLVAMDISNPKAPAVASLVKLKAPTGYVTSVPEGIVDTLIESGYVKA